jgi:tetratricopeptide (TPR) repeat protein
MMGGTQAGGPAPGAAQPGPEQMRAMADKKVEPLLAIVKANPNDTDTLTKIGTLYIAAGQFDESAKYFEKVTVIKPTADAWTKLSNAQAYGGSADKAIASLNKALQLDPKFANALYNLGMLKWQVQGDVKGAIACWEDLVKMNPNHPQLNQVKQLIAHVKHQQSMQPTGVKP